jgi:hypothetical protein
LAHGREVPSLPGGKIPPWNRGENQKPRIHTDEGANYEKHESHERGKEMEPLIAPRKLGASMSGSVFARKTEQIF